ncbi:MAG: oligosaccharide flippase family protein [Chthoniobacterales bacterium]
MTKARSAVIWNTGFNLFRDGIQFGVMLVLVRLLAPAAYGQFSLVTSIVGILSIFGFNNFIAHTLQIQHDSDVDYQLHFTMGGAMQLAMFALTNIVATALHWLPAYASVAPAVHVMSITFLLEWPCELRRKMIERSFDWRRLRILHAVGLVMNGIIAIIMAWMGAGVYALLVPGLAVTLPFIYDLFIRERWAPTWSWSVEKYRKAFRFGVARMGSGLTTYGKQLLESALFVSVLGFSSLGIMTRSVGLAQMFCLKFASQLMYAIYPMLTRLDTETGGAARIGGMILRLVAWTVFPVAICFGVLANPVVRTVYGGKWAAVVPLLPWAMGWGAAAALTQASYSLLLARNQARRCLFADALFLIGTVLALVVALPYGSRSYLAASTGAQAIVLVVVLTWLIRLSALTGKGLFFAFAPALVGCLLSGFVTFTAFELAQQSVAPFLAAVIWGLVFLTLYTLTIRVLFPRALTDLVRYFPARAVLGRALFLPDPGKWA